MIVVVGGIKGGSGKTTLATNLTVMRAATGNKVLLVDADEQKSSYDWASQRESYDYKIQWTTITLSGSSIHSQIERLYADYEDIIVDVGGRDTTSQRSALMSANVFLVPFKPRSLDIWTLGNVRQMIDEITTVNSSLKSFAVLNQADNRGTDNNESLEVLSECPNITCLSDVIQNRKAFCNAASQGLGVIELKPSDKKATAEMQAIHDKIYHDDI